MHLAQYRDFPGRQKNSSRPLEGCARKNINYLIKISHYLPETIVASSAL